jgi:hypothetical protein
MNWLSSMAPPTLLLVVTPIAGTLSILIGVLFLRILMPLKRIAAPPNDSVDQAIERTAVTIAGVVGATIRDERLRVVEAMLETQTENELEKVLLNRVKRGMENPKR